jgi:hypothetical protein
VALPYQVILTLASLVLAARHVLDSRASARSRVLVVALVAGSLLVPGGLAWSIASVLTQLGVSLALLLRAIAQRPRSPHI